MAISKESPPSGNGGQKRWFDDDKKTLLESLPNSKDLTPSEIRKAVQIKVSEEKELLQEDDPARGGGYLPPLPRVPLEAFPAEAQELLANASEAFNTPLEIPVACLLDLLSCLVGCSKLIELQKSWREPGNLWLVTVASSGVGKSPCKRAFYSSVRGIEVEEYKRWKESLECYEMALAAYNKEAKAYLTALGKDATCPPVPKKPVLPERKQLYLDDTTLEALSNALADNPRGVQWCSDEISGLIAGFDKYTSGKGDTRSRLLRAYDGDNWKINRVGDPLRNHLIKNAHVGISGGIQPGMMGRVFEAGDAGVDEVSGFLQRFLFIRAEREAPAYFTNKFLSSRSKELLSKISQKLWSIKFEEDEESRLIKLSGGAKKAFITWHDNLADEGFLDDAIDSHWKKLNGQTLRVALLLHMLGFALGDDVEKGELIDEAAMRKALLVVDWLKEHKRQCLAMFSKQKALPPLERAAMEVIVELSGKIAGQGWKVSNEELFGEIREKLRMPEMTPETLGHIAKKLGLPACSVNQNKRGRMVTAEKIAEFKTALGVKD